MVTTGETFTVERTFTEADVRTFADLSGDEGEHHLEPDERGRLLVHGLLTATLPTQVGGSHDVLARRMAFEFHRPVHTGDTVVCEVEYVRAESVERGREVEGEFEATVDGEVVLSGRYEGLIRDPDERVD